MAHHDDHVYTTTVPYDDRMGPRKMNSRGYFISDKVQTTVVAAVVAAIV